MLSSSVPQLSPLAVSVAPHGIVPCATSSLLSPSSLSDPLSLFEENVSSAFRPTPWGSENLLLSAIHTLVGSPSVSEASESAPSSSENGDDAMSNMMCQVCCDRASGYHYGVFACEGCKGFFRRSIQQKISYRACSKSETCLVVRSNRNRCQFCRLKKCLAVGMSRDAVRFGRVPKREKVKMLEELRRSRPDGLDEMATSERVAAAFDQLLLVMCPCWSSSRCPIPFHNYLPMVKAVVVFANSIPGFTLLPAPDRISLIKSNIWSVLLIVYSSCPGSAPPSSLSSSLHSLSCRLRSLSPSVPALLAALVLVRSTVPCALFEHLLACVCAASCLSRASVLAVVSQLDAIHCAHSSLHGGDLRARHPSLSSLLARPCAPLSPPLDEPLDLCIRRPSS